MAAVPAPRPGQLQVEVDAPFVFRGDEPAPPPVIAATVRWSERAPLLHAFPEMAPRATLASVTAISGAAVAGGSPASTRAASTQAASTQTLAQAPKRGVLGRIRGFFAALFR